jgi:hypothetical protein
LLGYTSAPLLCISYKCYGLSFLASMLASLPKPMWLVWLGDSMRVERTGDDITSAGFAVDH